MVGCAAAACEAAEADAAWLVSELVTPLDSPCEADEAEATLGAAACSVLGVVECVVGAVRRPETIVGEVPGAVECVVGALIGPRPVDAVAWPDVEVRGPGEVVCDVEPAPRRVVPDDGLPDDGGVTPVRVSGVPGSPA